MMPLLRSRRAAAAILNIGLSAGLVTGLVLLLDRGQLVQALKGVDYRWMLVAVVAIVGSDYARAWRWQILLTPLGSPRVADLFRVMVISLGINNLLPLRAGDLFRIQFMGARDFSRSSVFATMAAERLLDAVAFALISVAALVVGYGVAVRVLALSYLGVIAIGFPLAILLVYRSEHTRELLPRLPFLSSGKRRETAERFLEDFALGLRILSRPRLLAWAILASLTAWLIAGVGYYLVGRAMGIPLGLLGFLVIAVVANTIVAIPITQGSIGPYEIGITYFLVQIAGVPSSTAAAYAVLAHALVFIPPVVLAVPMMWSLHMRPKDVFYLHRGADQAARAAEEHHAFHGRQRI